jgi:hypothetical protein
MWYSNLSITSVSRHILQQHYTLLPSLYHCVRTCSVEVFLTVVSATSRRWSGIICYFWTSLREFFGPSCEPLYVMNTFHRKKETFLYEYSLHWVLLLTRKRKGTLMFGSILLKHGRQFDYWNHPLNVRMCVCCLHRHETGLCCYLVIHIENLFAFITAVLLQFCVIFTDSPS